MDDVDKTREDLDKAYEKVREDLGKVFVAFEDLRNADATEDITALIDNVETVLKKVRTGGLFGRGANSHRRAREKWLAAGGK